MGLKKFLNKKIIIFGTSVEGMFTLEILKQYNITPFCYIDNNKQKLETNYDNIIIKPVDYLYQLKSDEYIILIPSLYYNDMYKQLIDMKIPKRNIANIEIYYKPLSLFDIPYKIKLYFFMHKYFMKK